MDNIKDNFLTIAPIPNAPQIQLSQGDNIKYMQTFEDSFFDLVLADPPYNLGRDGHKGGNGWKSFEAQGWDSEEPSEEYFSELFRVGKKVVIWGANYYPQHLPRAAGWLVWAKGQNGQLSMGDGELAFTNFKSPLRIFTANRCKIKNYFGNIHPTEKPAALWGWIYQNAISSVKRPKVLDINLGSAGSAVAAALMPELNIRFWGVDNNSKHFSDAVERLQKIGAQFNLFQF